MAEEKKETLGQEGGSEKSSCCSFVDKKVLLGGVIGLVLAGAGFGLYSMGKCAGKAGKVCPISAAVTAGNDGGAVPSAR